MDERLGKLELLDHVHRLQPRASSRCTSAGLLGMPRRIYTYPAGMGWDGAEPDHHASARSCSRSASCCSASTSVVSLQAGAPAGPQSVGRADARMGDAVAAAALQLRRHPDGREPPSAVGGSPRPSHESRSRPGRHAARQRQETIGTTPLDAEPDVILRDAGATRSRPCSSLAPGARHPVRRRMLVHSWWWFGAPSLAAGGHHRLARGPGQAGPRQDIARAAADAAAQAALSRRPLPVGSKGRLRRAGGA